MQTKLRYYQQRIHFLQPYFHNDLCWLILKFTCLPEFHVLKDMIFDCFLLDGNLYLNVKNIRDRSRKQIIARHNAYSGEIIEKYIFESNWYISGIAMDHYTRSIFSVSSIRNQVRIHNPFNPNEILKVWNTDLYMPHYIAIDSINRFVIIQELGFIKIFNMKGKLMSQTWVTDPNRIFFCNGKIYVTCKHPDYYQYDYCNAIRIYWLTKNGKMFLYDKFYRDNYDDSFEGICVDSKTGYIYVANQSQHCVEVFTGNMKFVRQYDFPKNENPDKICIDSDHGILYVIVYFETLEEVLQKIKIFLL